MVYYEKDYIMRLIHGISRALARLFLSRELEDAGAFLTVLDTAVRETDDYLKRMIDAGRINAAENRLFELIGSSAWERKQLAALVLSFYDYANTKDDAFLEGAGFSRDEIAAGLDEAMKAVGLEIPEYLKI